MANETPIGDLVRLEDDERLDIPDARRLQSFVYEALADAIGGTFGPCYGVLSEPAFGAVVGAVTIGECVLVGIKAATGGSKRFRGGVFPYNPASSYQAGNTTINLSAYQSPEAFPYLWFCRRELEADIETRVRHVGGVESTYAPKTTRRQYIGFGATTDFSTPPNETEDWFIFARVTGWSGVFPNKVPAIEPVHIFDKGKLLGLYGTASNYLGAYMMDQDGGTGIAQAMGLLSHFILRLTSNTHTFDPSTLEDLAATSATFEPDPAVRGIMELHDDLEAAEAVLAATPRMLVWGSVLAAGTLSGPNFAGLNKLQAAAFNDQLFDVGDYNIHVRATEITSVQVTWGYPTPFSYPELHTTQPTYSVVVSNSGLNQSINVRFIRHDGAFDGERIALPFYIVVWGTPAP